MKNTNTSMTRGEIPWSGSITELSQLPGRVYVRLTTPALAKHFLQQAEAEGFTFPDGARPAKRKAAEIMAVNPDHTISYVGTNGRIAYGSCAETADSRTLIRIVYTG